MNTMNTQEQIADMRQELRRRIADRNAPGYWGVNARAWAAKLIQDIRATRQQPPVDNFGNK